MVGQPKTLTEDARKKTLSKLMVIFVLVMLAITFLSKTAANFMLPRVRVDRPSSGALIKEISGSGQVTAQSVSQQYADFNAKVTDVMVQAGQAVKKGQPVISLDTADLKSNLADEQDRYRQRELALGKLKDTSLSILNADNSIANAERVKQQKEADYANTKARFGQASQDDLDQAQAAMQQAEQDYAAAVEAKAKLLRDNQRDVANAQADLDIEARKVAALQRQLSLNGVYTAPADGVITELNFAKGSMANNSQPLFKLADPSQGFQLKISLDWDLASYAKVGDQVSLNVVSLGDKKGNGTISEIRDGQNNQKDIYINLSIAGLSGGEQAQAYLPKTTKQYGTLVPNEAVYTDSNGSYVLVIKKTSGPLGEESYVQRVAATIQDSDSSKTALTGAGSMDRLVVYSTKPLADGEKVVIEQ